MTDTQLADRELEALLSLLGTESDRSLAVIVEQVRAFPLDRLQRLAELAAARGGPDDHLNLLLAERDSPRLQALFLRWLAHGADLEEGALLVARVGYPLLDTQHVRDRLDQLAAEARNHCGPESPRDSLAALIQIVTGEWHFHGDSDDYYNPDNCYLNAVLARRKGLPITLSILYMMLGRRLGMHISGIGLPSHFIACLQTTDVPLYFDPFDDGTLLTEVDVKALVETSGLPFRAAYLRPSDNVAIIRRMLTNLVNMYDMHEDLEWGDLVRQHLAAISFV